MNKLVMFFLIILVYTTIYYKKHVYSTKVFTKNHIIKSIGNKKVFPFYLIPFGIFQTVLQLFRKISLISDINETAQLLEMKDGGEILIDIIEPIEKQDFEENVLLIHGLNGSSKSTYIIGMANVFLKRGCRVFCYNARGARTPPKNDLFSHHGLTSDIHETVEFIADKYSGNISLIGFSLGSNWVAKFLGEIYHPRVRLGISICCPFDFVYLCNYFKSKRLFHRFISFMMSRNYKRYLRRSMVSVINFDKYRYLDEIDTTLLDILGKDDLVEFYKESSCASYILRINVPFLFISAEDDPLIPTSVIPFDAFFKNPNIGLILLKGGHLGFFTNKSETMAEILAAEFFERVISSGVKG